MADFPFFFSISLKYDYYNSINKIHSVIFGFVWLSEKNPREKKTPCHSGKKPEKKR